MFPGRDSGAEGQADSPCNSVVPDLASSSAPGVRTSRCGPHRDVGPGTASPVRLRLMVAPVAPDHALCVTTRSKVEQVDLAVDVVYAAPRAFGEPREVGRDQAEGLAAWLRCSGLTIQREAAKYGLHA